MDLALLIGRYGLPVVFLGALLEGETVLLIAGFAAHRGYLDFGAVVAVAWAGAVLGDQFYFWLGRRHGRALLARWPSRAAAVQRALALIERHPRKIVLAMRFAWGLRTALPIAIGLSRMPRLRFFWLNLVSAALWAPAVAGAGWVFGELLTRHLGDLQRMEHWAIAALAAAMLTVHLWRRWRRRAR
ncbi:MAG: DedA family protein [Thiobacillaceae bacterium]|nr:DedA family protein [Thiobacillaceae bacterium]MDW8324155.1 DedA family protein [Burkholderiales bacterium]